MSVAVAAETQPAPHKQKLQPQPLGPSSLTWRYFADYRAALLGPRAAVLQNMLPALGQGVLDHSVFFKDTFGRLQRSIPPILKTVYGTEDTHPGKSVRDYHKHVKGTFADGKHYHALDPDTYFWAHATFVDQVIAATDTFIRRLTDAEKEQIWAEGKTWYLRYGVSDKPMPDTYKDFQAYWERMFDEELVAHKTAKYGVGYVRKGIPGPKQLPPLAWKLLSMPLNRVAAFLTTGGMPEKARAMLDLPWTEREERLYEAFTAFIRALDPFVRRLPPELRLHPIAAKAFRQAKKSATAISAGKGLQLFSPSA